MTRFEDGMIVRGMVARFVQAKKENRIFPGDIWVDKSFVLEVVDVSEFPGPYEVFSVITLKTGLQLDCLETFDEIMEKLGKAPQGGPKAVA